MDPIAHAELSAGRPAAPRMLATLTLALSIAPALAQNIATDGSLGAPAQVLTGPSYAIPEALGHRSGANLFHSFQRFGLEFGERARFTTDTANLQNVFARVTGGGLSSIAGTIELQAAAGSAPALYLMNPAGIVFTDGATIDVPGAFHVTTADAIRFPDGRFAADPALGNVFSSAAPEAFGFLASHAGELRIQRVARIANGDQPVDAVAREVVVAEFGELGANHADVRVVAFGPGAGEVPLAGPVAAAAGALVVRDQGAIFTQTSDERPAGAISIDAGRMSLLDNGLVSSRSEGVGAAGALRVEVRDATLIARGGVLGTLAGGAGRGGDVALHSGSLEIDGGPGAFAGVLGLSSATATGDSGHLAVTVDGTAVLRNSGSLNASTFGRGRAGDLRLRAGELRIEGGAGAGGFVISNAARDALGGGGVVEIEVTGAMRMDGGTIGADTFGAGDGGAIALSVGDALTMTDAAIEATAYGAGAAGIVAVEVGGDLAMTRSSIDSGTVAEGSGGAVVVRVAGSADMQQGKIGAESFGAGPAGVVWVDVGGDLSLTGGSIDSDTSGAGDAGQVLVEVAGQTRLREAALISSETLGSGAAGRIIVDTGSLDVDGGGLPTGITSDGNFGATGNAGDVLLLVAGEVRLVNGGAVKSDAFGSGHGGSVTVAADRVLLDGGVISSSAFGTGDAGEIRLVARSLQIGVAESARGSAILSAVGTDSPGRGGDLQLTVGELLELAPGGLVSTTTLGSGDAGNVTIRAGELRIDGGALGAGISSDTGSTGAAGVVTIGVEREASIAGGLVSSSTIGAGPAGAVVVAAEKVSVLANGGIVAIALASSGGQVGNLLVAATDELLLDRGNISISNQASSADPSALRASALTVEAPVIRLREGATITAESFGNIPASAIEVDFGRLLRLEDGRISTSATDGDGGAVAIRGDGLLQLRRAGIHTSVFGISGDGGDIAVAADMMVMESAFIQANTAAAAASGGDVRVEVRQIVPSGGTLIVGGDTPVVVDGTNDLFGFNVIQAAAPTGVSGNIRVSASPTDVAGSLAELAVPRIDLGSFARDPCAAGQRNSFSVGARRGTFVAPDAMLRAWPGPSAAAGLARLACARGAPAG